MKKLPDIGLHFVYTFIANTAACYFDFDPMVIDLNSARRLIEEKFEKKLKALKENILMYHQ